MTPFVFKDKLYRVESIDKFTPVMNTGIKEKDTYAVIRDLENGNIISKLGQGCYFFDAFVDNDTAYVIGTENSKETYWLGGDTLIIFESADLINWKSRILIQKEGWLFFNHGLTKNENESTKWITTSTSSQACSANPAHPLSRA